MTEGKIRRIWLS